MDISQVGRMLYYDILISFLKAGTTTYGGGPAAIPVIKEEAVDTHQWLTEGQFVDALAFGNSLPGPIATKLAAFVGYKAGGIVGSTIALCATVLPTALIMIMLYSVYTKYSETAWMKNMLAFVKPVVFILILDICVGMRGMFTNYQPYIIAVITALGLYVFKISPPLLIISSLAAGILLAR